MSYDWGRTMNEYSDIVSDGKIDPRWARQTNLKDIPHPAKSQWRGLTDDDVNEITKNVIAFKSDVVQFIKEAEAKLKEKNGG